LTAQIVVDVLGWTGTALFLAAYLLVSLKRVEGDSVLYQAMNIAAGALLVINTFYWRAYPSFGLNIVWIAIGVYTLARRHRWR
jgi:hypothetical protein